jgi:hypothetical protein
MPVTTEGIIRSIHTKLDALLVAAGGSAVPYGIGGVAKDRQQIAPRIIWDDSETSGAISPLRRTGKDRHRWAEDRSKWRVHIWCVDTDDGLTSGENCQVTAHNLFTATRRTVGSERAYGVETVLMSNYGNTRTGHAKKGSALTLEVEIIIMITDDVWATVVGPEFDGFGVLLPSEETPQDELQEFSSEFSGEFTS